MFYSGSLTIPANTPNTAPATLQIPVTEGTITRLWVRWRWGSANLCGCRLLHAGFQFWPLSLGQWYPSTTAPLDFADAYPLDTDPYEIRLEGYNLDDTFEHNVWVGIEVKRYRMSEAMRQFLADLGESL